jgi:hypothetical protein
MTAISRGSVILQQTVLSTHLYIIILIYTLESFDNHQIINLESLLDGSVCGQQTNWFEVMINLQA